MTEQEMRTKAKALFDETLETLQGIQSDLENIVSGVGALVPRKQALEDGFDLPVLFRAIVQAYRPWDLDDTPFWPNSMDHMPAWAKLPRSLQWAAIGTLSHEDVGILKLPDGMDGIPKEIRPRLGTDKLRAILEGKPKHRDPHGLIVKWSEDCADHTIEVWREYLLDNGWEEGHREPGVHRFLKENDWGLYPHCIDIPDPSFADYKRHIADAMVTLCNTEDTTPYKLNTDLIRTVEKLRRLEERGDPEECERSPTSWLGHSWGEQHLRRPKYMNAENPPALACVFCGKEKKEKTQDRTAQSAEGAVS